MQPTRRAGSGSGSRPWPRTVLPSAANDYEVDRYQQVGGLAAELLAVLSGRPAEELVIELGRDSGYATPKVDVRGVVFDSGERVLLMQEKIRRPVVPAGRLGRSGRGALGRGQPGDPGGDRVPQPRR